MPRSKRSSKVSLTSTRGKGGQLKQKIITEVRENVDTYSYIFLFSTHNMRNNRLKDVRTEWRDSRFYFGKNKVVAFALGRSVEEEYQPNLHKLSKRLIGQMGLLFTNKKKAEVLEYFKHLSDPDFARAGNEAGQTVTINKGPLPAFSHAMEPQLRALGLPTSLNKGVVTLVKDFKICEMGQTLTSEQCRILKNFGHKMVDFRINIEAVWSNGGEFEVFDAPTLQDFVSNSVRLRPREEEGDDGFEAKMDDGPTPLENSDAEENGSEAAEMDSDESD